MIDTTHLTVRELLSLQAKVGDELRDRKIVRSSNQPTGDLAEYLFCKAFGWKQTENSNPNFDALSSDNKLRYQIKGRRLTRYNKSRQLSAIRDLDKARFDFLAAVLFAEDYSVYRAAIIPYDVALKRATFVEYTNSHKFMLRDDVWEVPDVCDVTQELRNVPL